MLHQDLTAAAVSQAIQLAVAPVFLLAGIGAMLNVLSTRLGRIVDYARVLEARLLNSSGKEHAEIQARLAVLSKRARLSNTAIGLSGLCALLICTVIVILFLEVFLSIEVPTLIGLMFILAMLAFIAALLCFLREVYIATANLRIGPH
ncbi:MAG: DUF2721 domain-containing protein [Burkholderiales bacterium]